MNVSKFCKTVKELIENRQLPTDWYLIQDQEDATVHQSENDKGENIYFGEMTKLLFLHYDAVYRKYRKVQYDKKDAYLDKEYLFALLKNSYMYVGKTKAKKINGKAKRCLIFKYDSFMK